MLDLDFKNSNINIEEILKYKDKVTNIHNELHEKESIESEFLGWLSLPINYDKEEFLRIKKSALKIRNDSKVLLVIGIGGSYLGARAVISLLKNSFNNDDLEIIYVGNNLDSTYISEVKDYIKDKDFSINVISKSGTTTEPAIAFRIFKEILESKYGFSDACRRIYATTDKVSGALNLMAKNNNYETFVIPNNIGGRYSVLTAVGLLPIAAAGFDIDKLMKGAYDACIKYNNSNLDENICYHYAVLRNILYNKNKNIEMLVAYNSKMHYFIEWWKQLFGESEGKDGLGLFPVGGEFTTDLHSLGQYIQDGKKLLFETVINIITPVKDIVLTKDEKNLDNLNYLEGKTIDYVNKKAMEGTMMAHINGNVPNILFNVLKLDEESIGHLIYFFCLACAMSSKILGVNPFNQPGVEEYKNNMFRLLGKNI